MSKIYFKKSEMYNIDINNSFRENIFKILSKYFFIFNIINNKKLILTLYSYGVNKRYLDTIIIQNYDDEYIGVSFEDMNYIFIPEIFILYKKYNSKELILDGYDSFIEFVNLLNINYNYNKSITHIANIINNSKIRLDFFGYNKNKKVTFILNNKYYDIMTDEVSTLIYFNRYERFIKSNVLYKHMKNKYIQQIKNQFYYKVTNIYRNFFQFLNI